MLVKDCVNEVLYYSVEMLVKDCVNEVLLFVVQTNEKKVER